MRLAMMFHKDRPEFIKIRASPDATIDEIRLRIFFETPEYSCHDLYFKDEPIASGTRKLKEFKPRDLKINEVFPLVLF